MPTIINMVCQLPVFICALLFLSLFTRSHAQTQTNTHGPTGESIKQVHQGVGASAVVRPTAGHLNDSQNSFPVICTAAVRLVMAKVGNSRVDRR